MTHFVVEAQFDDEVKPSDHLVEFDTTNKQIAGQLFQDKHPNSQVISVGQYNKPGREAFVQEVDEYCQCASCEI